MGWRDRLRRRAAAQAEPSGSSGDTAASQDTGAVRDFGVPGDWDGGWRGTVPPRLTVSRAPMGVSDGLAFRAGLAAWRDPSFDTGLAHALLPTAPTGLVRGVARPTTARPTHDSGGPLLLRALSPYGADGAPDPEVPFGAVRQVASGPARERDTPPIARGTRSDAPSASPESPGRSASGGRGAVGDGTAPAPHGSGSGAAPASTPGSGRSVPNAAPPARDTGGGSPRPFVARATTHGVGASDAPPVAENRTPSDASSETGRPGGGSGTRGLTSAHSPSVLGTTEPAVQRAGATGGGTALSPAAPGGAATPPSFPLIRRIAVVPEVPASAPPMRRTPAGASGTSGSAEPSSTPPGRRTTSRTAGSAKSTGTSASASTPPVQRTAASAPGSDKDSGSTHSPSRPSTASTPPGRRTTASASASGSGSGSGSANSPSNHSDASTPPVQRTAVSGPSAGSDRSGRAGTELPVSAAPRTVQPHAETAYAPVRPRAVDRSLTVARVPAMPRRRVSVVPFAVTPAPDGPVAPHSPERRTGSRAPLGPPLTGLPPTAVPSGTGTSAPRSTPASPMPVVQRQVEPPAGGGPESSAHPRAAKPDSPSTPLLAQRQAEPSADGPITPDGTRRRPSPADPTAPAPAMPMVQRLADSSAGNGPQPTPHSRTARPADSTPRPEATGDTGRGRTTPRVRTGLGAPLPAMPPSAALPTPPTSRPRADVQSAPTPPSAPPVHTPLLGTRDAQRRTVDSSAAQDTAPQAAAPLVRRTTASPDRAGGAGTPSGPRRADSPAATGGIHPIPLAAGTAPLPAPRTLRLLAARPLTLGTRALGSPAAPATRPASRPVVAARWPGTAAPTPQVQRAAGTPLGARADAPAGTSSRPAHVVRPASGPYAAPASPAAPRTAAPLPMTGPQAPPLAMRPPAGAPSAQPVPVVRPKASAPAPGATGPSPTANAAPVQRATGGGIRTDAGPTAAGGRQRPAPNAPASARTEPHGADVDLDDLARRLLDPVARLLRTELRRGRERAGRPFDGRR
ncbi:hypothetical protein [Streptomyces sp. NPDC056527]|uniref:hypothetical protein n=1 Tax=Streptomyces sp. NPDC056527 TaxID=3345853 RepID=UPI0036C43E1D